MPKSPDVPTAKLPLLLRRADQVVVGGLVLGALASLAGYWILQDGHRGELIEIERADPLPYQFLVNINEAEWPELAQLPDVGEVRARRIVESRTEEGLFFDHQDLLRVDGIGPLTLERIRPHLLPLPGGSDVAGTERPAKMPVP